MAAHIVPASSPSNIVKGSDEVLNLEERLSTGEPKAVLDTPVWRGIICQKIVHNWPDDSDADEDVEVKTPVTGRTYKALAAVQATAESSAGPDAMQIVVTIVESSSQHLQLWKNMRGKYFALLHSLGARGTNYTDFAAFVKFKSVAMSQSYEPGKEVSFDLTFEVANNTEDCVFSVTDFPTGEVHATACTIDAGDGFKYIDTAI